MNLKRTFKVSMGNVNDLSEVPNVGHKEGVFRDIHALVDISL